MEDTKKIKADKAKKMEEINMLISKYENAVNEYIELLLEEMTQEIHFLEVELEEAKLLHKKITN